MNYVAPLATDTKLVPNYEEVKILFKREVYGKWDVIGVFSTLRGADDALALYKMNHNNEDDDNFKIETWVISD